MPKRLKPTDLLLLVVLWWVIFTALSITDLGKDKGANVGEPPKALVTGAAGSNGTRADSDSDKTLIQIGIDVVEAIGFSSSRMMLAAFSWVFAFALVSTLIWLYRWSIEGHMMGEERFGSSVSLGRLPGVPDDLPRAAPPSLPPAAKSVTVWLKRYEQSQPEYANLFQAILNTLYAHRHYPASKVPGGHGSLDLYSHSLNVCSTMLALADTYEYIGVANNNSKGEFHVKLRRPSYEFDRADPLIGICALAHDIGKIKSFQVAPSERDGAYQVVTASRDHSEAGAQILARMPEYWALPFADRRAIALVVAHYHAPFKLPMEWASSDDPDNDKLVSRDDRTVAILELLLKADIQTGLDEGRYTDEAAKQLEERGFDRDGTEKVNFFGMFKDFFLQIKNPSLKTHEAAQADEDDEDCTDIFGEDNGTEPPETPPVLVNVERYNAYLDLLYDTFAELIVEPMALNGSSSEKLGFKQGRWIYILEPNIREALVKRLGLPDPRKLKDKTYRITRDLSYALMRRKLLLTKWKDRYYSHKSALFIIKTTKKESKKEADNSVPGDVSDASSKKIVRTFKVPAFVIYLDPVYMSGAARIDDNSWRVEVVRPLFTTRGTLNPDKEILANAIDLNRGKEDSQTSDERVVRRDGSSVPTGKSGGRQKLKAEPRATDAGDEVQSALADEFLGGIVTFPSQSPASPAPAPLATVQPQSTPQESEGLSIANPDPQKTPEVGRNPRKKKDAKASAAVPASEEAAVMMTESASAEMQEPLDVIPLISEPEQAVMAAQTVIPMGHDIALAYERLMNTYQLVERLFKEGKINPSDAILSKKHGFHFFKVSLLKETFGWSISEWDMIIKSIQHGAVPQFQIFVTPSSTVLMGSPGFSPIVEKFAPAG